MIMGIAAYNRGSALISFEIERWLESRSRNSIFARMDYYNALPKKHVKVAKPFSKLAITYDLDRNIWWMQDAEKMGDGFGYWYRSLRDAIRSWDISLSGYSESTHTWFAEPN